MCKLLGSEYEVEVFREPHIFILSGGNKEPGVPQSSLDGRLRGSASIQRLWKSRKVGAEEGGDMIRS